MSRSNVLNPHAAEPGLEAVTLSGRLLDGLRARPGGQATADSEDLAAQLHGIDPGGIEGDESRIAFWLNLYNALLLQRLAVKPAHGNMLLHPRIFSATAYEVGGDTYALNQIEHGVLRRNSPAPFPPRRPFREGDARLRTLPSRLDPRIHFALNCGARSCPPIRTYSPERLDTDLSSATRAYLAAETGLERTVVSLPRLMRIYAADFGSQSDQLEFAAGYLPDLELLRLEATEPISVEYGRFDWAAATTGGPTQ